MSRYWIDSLGVMCDEVTCRMVERPDWDDAERARGKLNHAPGHKA